MSTRGTSCVLLDGVILYSAARARQGRKEDGKGRVECVRAVMCDVAVFPGSRNKLLSELVIMTVEGSLETRPETVCVCVTA